MPAEQWPELVGRTADEAVAVIRRTNPDIVRVPVLADGSLVTADFREDRVRVFTDADDHVTRVPRIG
ncbi:serine protease inhibitor [Streptomyces sp. NPDC058701]|uniref:serine protease inhibitor n=1 Tax=Streptomyces sp. NPDC058701 TaxID=3346608 RepID=UPI00364DFBE0